MHMGSINLSRESLVAIGAVVMLAFASASLKAADAGEDLEKKLNTVAVTFQFNSTPLVDVLKQISTKVGIPITLDPALAGSSLPPITLGVSEMKARGALEWAVKLTELEFAVIGKEVFVSTPKGIAMAKEKAAK